MPGDVYISNPSWANHQAIINNVGLPLYQYTYYDPRTKGLNFDGMISDLRKARPGSIILLHTCAHNPTGVDPTQEQWKVIAQVMKENELFPYFDMAYQGFATGDLARDTFAIRHFIDLGFQLIVTQSFAKNMGLYGERIGAFHIVSKSKAVADKVLS